MTVLTVTVLTVTVLTVTVLTVNAQAGHRGFCATGSGNRKWIA